MHIPDTQQPAYTDQLTALRKQLVEITVAYAIEDDDEKAASIERQMQWEALQHIATNSIDQLSREVAKAALQSLRYRFKRG